MTALAWLLVLRAPGPFAVRCDRIKVFYGRGTWSMTGVSGGKDRP